MGSIHVTEPEGKPDVKDKTCHCGKKSHFAENCSDSKNCGGFGSEGRFQVKQSA